MTYEVTPVQCQEPDCERTYKPHRWGSIKAHGEGWYIQKDEKAWCPDHRPSWAPPWPKP